MKNNTPRTAVLLSAALLVSSMAQPIGLCAQVVNSAAGRAAAPGVSGVSAVSLGSGLMPVSPLSGPAAPGLSASAGVTLAAPAIEVSPAGAADAALSIGVEGVVAPEAAAALEFAQTAQVSAPAAAPAEHKSLVARLAHAVVSKLNPARFFDASRRNSSGMEASSFDKGPLKPVELPKGVVLDHQPISVPTPVRLPGFTPENDGSSQKAGFEAAPFVLAVDPADNEAIKAAVGSYIDAHAANFNGVSAAGLQIVEFQRLKTIEHQTDTVVIVMRQHQKGVLVHGTRAEFTIKLIAGKLTAFPAKPVLYGDLAVDTVPKFTEDQLRAKIQKRLGIPPQSDIQLDFIERKIVNAGGTWRTANLYVIKGLPVMVAVDVVTGKVFAWDPRSAAGKAAVAKGKTGLSHKVASFFGSILGRGENDDKRVKGEPVLTPQPMANLFVTLEDGRKVVTDANGRLSLPDDKPIKYTAVLQGTYAKVNNRHRGGKPLKISGTFVPGQDNVVVFNPEGASLLEVDQVNAYVHYTKLILWGKARGLDDKRLDFQMEINVNIDDECNAYYTPGRPSLNFFVASANCSDTGRPGVIYHEGGHGIDDAIGGIINGALSEGWGDIMSMYILGSPIIGEGFLKKRTPDYIRHGENDYQYGQYDEVHDQGQAWMGFAWKLRQALILSLGAAAGAVMAEALVLPTLYAKATTIPEAIAQVLLNDMDKNGVMPHEKEIRAAALAHGISLPKNPGLFSTFLGGSFLEMRNGQGPINTEEAGQGVEGPLWGPLESLEGVSPTATVRAKLTFSAGLLVRGQVAREIRKYCDLKGLKYDLKEYRGVFSSDFLLTVEGAQADVSILINAIKAFSNR